MCSFAKYFSFPDVRTKREYDESHVMTALLVKKVYGQSQGLGQTRYLTGTWEERAVLFEVQEAALTTGYCGQQRQDRSYAPTKGVSSTATRTS